MKFLSLNFSSHLIILNYSQISYILAILYEQTDDIVSSLIAHLNASLLFFRDQYGLDDGLIFFDPFLLPHAATNISTNATGLDLSLRQRNSSFLISLCSTHAVREVTRRLMLPAIQIHHSPWNGVENGKILAFLTSNLIS